MTDVLYKADLSFLSDNASYDRAYASLSQSRKEKVDRLRVREEKIRCIGAGLLFAYVCAIYGADESDLLYDPFGKPYLKNDPFYFNLSHSGRTVICTVSDVPVGCDVEQNRPRRTVAGLCTPEETEWLNDESHSFLLLWTRKESYMKAVGKGLSLRPDSFSVPLTFNQATFDGTFSFLNLSDERDFISVCIRKKTENIPVKNVILS